MKTAAQAAALLLSATAIAVGAPPYRVNTNLSMFVFSDPNVQIFRDDFNPSDPNLGSLSTRELTTLAPFTGEYVDSLSTYGALRFMDWNLTNNSDRKLWAERPSPLTSTRASIEPLIDDATGQTRLRRDGAPLLDSVQGSFNLDKDVPVAYEWMIALANQANKDIWINVPHMVVEEDPSYARNLATLLRDGLDPDLKVYVEYSNEVWNGGFAQSAYAIERGLTRITGPDATGDFIPARQWYQENEPGAVDQIDPNGAVVLRDGVPLVENGDPVGGNAGAIWTVNASIQLWEDFADVFASDFDDRVVTVLPGQAGVPSQTRFMLELLDLPSINPNGVRPDAFAIAPYVGAELAVPASGSYADDVNATIDALFNEIAPGGELVTTLAADKGMLDERGIDFITYEGGQHLVGEGSGIVNRDPRMEDFYRTYFQTLVPFIDEYFHWYDRGFFLPPDEAEGTGGFESFGATEFLGQPASEAPKLRAILEWNARGVVPEPASSALMASAFILAVIGRGRTSRYVTADLV